MAEISINDQLKISDLPDGASMAKDVKHPEGTCFATRGSDIVIFCIFLFVFVYLCICV